MADIKTAIEPSIRNTRAMNISKKIGRRYSLLDAMLMGKRLGINWQKEKFTVGDLLVGMHYELEHGKVDSSTNVTNDSPKKTAKIAWAHLKERPDYYVQLMKIDPPKKLEKRLEKKEEKTAAEALDFLYKQASFGDRVRSFCKQAAYLKDINCEECHYVGPPDPDGTCPKCGSIGGHKALGLQKKYERSLKEIEDDAGSADDAAREEQENLRSMIYGG